MTIAEKFVMAELIMAIDAYKVSLEPFPMIPLMLEQYRKFAEDRRTDAVDRLDSALKSVSVLLSGASPCIGAE